MNRLYFYDRCGMTRMAINGTKTSTRVFIECNPDTPKSEVKVPQFALGEVVPIMMCYKDLCHFSERTLDAMLTRTHGNEWKLEYREEVKGKGWLDKYYADPELMLFHAEITGLKPTGKYFAQL